MKNVMKLMTISAVAVMTLLQSPVMAVGKERAAKRAVAGAPYQKDSKHYELAGRKYTRTACGQWLNSLNRPAGKTVVPQLQALYEAELKKCIDAANAGQGTAELMPNGLPENAQVVAQATDASGRTWGMIKIGTAMIVAFVAGGLVYHYFAPVVLQSVPTVIERVTREIIQQECVPTVCQCASSVNTIALQQQVNALTTVALQPGVFGQLVNTVAQYLPFGS